MMRDIALIVIVTIGAAVLCDLYVPLISFGDVILVAMFIGIVVLVDVVVKVTQAFFGGGSGGE